MTESALQIAVQAVRLYAETHPRPPHVTQRQAAAMLEVSAPTIGKLIKARKLSLNELGLIPIGQIDAMLAARVEVIDPELEKKSDAVLKRLGLVAPTA